MGPFAIWRPELVKTTVGDADSPNPKKGPKKRKTRAEKSCPDELKKYKMNYTHGRICWSFNLKDGCSLKTEKVDNKGYKRSKGFPLFVL